MKPAASAIAVLLAASACAAEPQDALILVAGQSNAVGYGVTLEDLPPEMRAPDPAVRIWDGDRFVPLAPGVNTGTPNRPEAWGPEVEFARAWRAARPNGRLHIVKLARGSTALAAGPDRDWSPASGELFAEMAREAREAQAAAGVPVTAVLWMQGEADAVQPQAARDYEANLRAFVAAVRGRWAGKDAAVVIGRIGGPMPFAAEVRRAQAAVDRADPRVTSVETSDLPRQADQLHLTPEGLRRLGQAMFEALP